MDRSLALGEGSSALLRTGCEAKIGEAESVCMRTQCAARLLTSEGGWMVEGVLL